MALFDPASSKPCALSRSKVDLFLECPRCFYCARVLQRDADVVVAAHRHALDRLKEFQRGTLSAGEIPIGATRAKGQVWGLSQTGNWSSFQEDTTGDGTPELSQTRTHGLVNQIKGITGGGWSTPGYDLAGNAIAVPRSGDLGNALLCKYDAWNRLVEVTVGSNTIQKNHYDGLNRRVRQDLDSQAPANPDGVIDLYRHYYYSSGWQVLETRESTSSTAAPKDLKPVHVYRQDHRRATRRIRRKARRRESSADPASGDRGLQTTRPSKG